MNSFSTAAVLLAEGALFRSLNQQFSGQNLRFGWTQALVIVLLLGAAAAIIWGLNWLASDDRQRTHNSPRGLFRELCRAHGLSLANRRLLHQLACQQQLADPARLFLEPERFEPARLGPVLQPHQQRIAALREKLFADSSSDDWSA